MEPMELLRLLQETAPDAEDRRADFQALVQGPYRREFEEAVRAAAERLQAKNAREKDAGTAEKGEEDGAQREAALRRHFDGLARQAEELRRTFPDFDLMREMRNPAFLRMTAPGTGVSVKDAFFAVHGEDIQRESMRYAAAQAGRRIAASVQAGASRPVENGIQAPAPVMIGVDIRGMNKKQREEYRRRIRSGEIINFSDRI